MGEVISLMERRERRITPKQARSAHGPVTCFFDLASPDTYLAAERVDRLFTDVQWVPVLLGAEDAAQGGGSARLAEAQQEVQRRAAALRMPLVWPDRTPAPARAAMRVGAHAAREGRAAAFVLAATRLAFCGGFDLDDPDILAEACAAAGLSLDDCLRAAGDPDQDEPMLAEGRRLQAQGADRIPAVRVGRMLFCGEHRIPEAMAAASVRRSSLRRTGV